MRLRQRFLSVSIAIFMAVVLSGCSALLIGAAAGAAGTYVWTHGNLELMVNYSADDLYIATREALDDLNILIERDRHDRFGANISARTDRNRKVLIKIVGQTEESSKIRVRVGIVGDREESQMVMNVILRNV